MLMPCPWSWVVVLAAVVLMAQAKVYTNQVIAAGTGRSGKLKESTKAGVSYTGSPNGIIPPSAELKVQSNINNWIVSCIERFDAVVPVGMGGILPAAGDYDGDLFYAGDSLFIWSEEHGWQAISAGDSGPPVYVGESEPPGTAQTGELWYCTDEKYLTLFIYTGTTWAAAAPPVSLDGIEAGIAGLTYAVDELTAITTNQGRDIADAKSTQYGIAKALEHLDDEQKRQGEALESVENFEEDQKRQDEKIAELEG